MEKHIIEALKEVENNFAKNKDELAYLALTKKIELPIVDKLAYLLHKKLGDKVKIAREWKDPEKRSQTKADIALIKKSGPIAVLEAKAIYTFDTRNMKKWVKAIQNDVEKSITSGKPYNAKVYTLLVATHPLDAPDPEYDGVIKYRRDIARSLPRKNSARELKELARKNVKKSFNNKIISAGVIDGGSAFKIQTKVFYWLMKWEYKRTK